MLHDMCDIITLKVNSLESKTQVQWTIRDFIWQSKLLCRSLYYRLYNL